MRICYCVVGLANCRIVVCYASTSANANWASYVMDHHQQMRGNCAAGTLRLGKCLFSVQIMMRSTTGMGHSPHTFLTKYT